ncbi:MAG: NADH-quinone oxidoreductase subunit N [Chloroflexi bacterium RBG_19FT_COMBO_62_14]|nr:MAG: NADH-quinone oxidoreductase subunit N [Chloroflexi bacterium RBG_19FT_COMBO_62_14]
MTSADILSLLPLLVVATTGVVVMLAAAFYRNHRLSLILTLAGLLTAFISLPFVSPLTPRQVTSLVLVDGYALFYMGLIFAAGFIVALLTYGYLEQWDGNPEELYVLLLLATLGAAVLVGSSHFASFFLGLETLSVALYAMIAYNRSLRRGIEAGIKYLVLAGVTAAFLLFGMALVYAETGTLAFSGVIAAAGGGPSLQLMVGLGMLIVGVGFKLGVVPFHMWTPDVYQGAPAPVTGLLASMSKGAMFALLLRYFTPVMALERQGLVWVFTAVAVLSMLGGNILALTQDNVKRILAYSSIAHLGYLLVAFLASGPAGQLAVAFYLVAYFATTLSAFGVVTVLSTPDDEAESLRAYQGLYYRRPWLAIIFTIALLSLAGIPPTAGLVGKIFIAAAGVQASLWLLLIVLVLASVIGVFYYMRIVITMFRRPEADVVQPSMVRLPRAASVVLGALSVILVGLGIYPVPVMRIIERTVARLV